MQKWILLYLDKFLAIFSLKSRLSKDENGVDEEKSKSYKNDSGRDKEEKRKGMEMVDARTMFLSSPEGGFPSSV